MNSKAFICLFVCISVAQSCALASPESEKSLTAGKIYAKQGKFQLAVTELRAAIERAPNNPDCWSILGACYMQMGKYDDAKVAYQKCTDLSTGVNSIPANFPANTVDDWRNRQETYERSKHSYMHTMELLIKRNWHPDKQLFTNSVQIQFKVSKGGTISGASVKKSSGDSTLDKAALDAVVSTPTLGNLPSELGEEINAIITLDNQACL